MVTDKSPSKSICIHCIHAYGDDCFSVPTSERIWVKKRKVKHRASNNQKIPYEIGDVVDCERFERGRKALNKTRYGPGPQIISLSKWVGGVSGSTPVARPEESSSSQAPPPKTKKEGSKMKTASAKAKGRNLQNWVCQKISDLTGFAWGKDELIASREMGQTGTDVRLVGEAQERFPFSVECKNQETWSIPAWIKQAKENQKEGTDWLLVCKRNRMAPIVVMDAEQFFMLLKRE